MNLSIRSPLLRATAGGRVLALVAAAVALGWAAPAFPQIDEEDLEAIDSDSCVDCHEESVGGSLFVDDLSHSVHEGFECLDCHTDRAFLPHDEPTDFLIGSDSCAECHEDESAEYVAHGRGTRDTNVDLPTCSDCHGSHHILPSSVKLSTTHPTNLPQTCGVCHENLDLTRKYNILIDHPIEIYENSVHGQATKGGVYVAATCNDCHSVDGNAHKILSPGYRESTINHFNIPNTCGKCHRGVAYDFWEGIHGQLVARGETDAPVCTDCHGEHGILAHSDPRSPVSRSRVAEITCSPCHESAVLNEKYGLATERLTTFIDSYHGLKSKAGDQHVANCASCHGVHRILPQSDPTSTVHPANLQQTCGECHPKITPEIASIPIHGVSGDGLITPVASVVQRIYIIAIAVIIGGMVIHWLIDLRRHFSDLFKRRPQVRRMKANEVVQHMLLAVTFIALVISGFALRFDQGFISKFFFGWERGFEIRGIVHRVAAVLFMVTVIWHVLYLLTRRGRDFLRDMMPNLDDFRFFVRKMGYNLGFVKNPPPFGRFSYVEKAEYWALVWGTVIMVVTGIMLWFDNTVIQFLPKGFLDVALVVHYWEAWLATLAILVWHFYSVMFSPGVYPMNPSWLTGRMPEAMYAHEHPGHLEEAKAETAQALRRHYERVAGRDEEAGPDEREGPPGSPTGGGPAPAGGPAGGPPKA